MYVSSWDKTNHFLNLLLLFIIYYYYYYYYYYK